VTSAAILAKLRPSYRTNNRFIEYVNTLIRDTTNPSAVDTYFPQFRSFDWFELHSWSRGIAPNGDGKDQESTSEELNLLFGIHLWGDMIGNLKLKQLGETMLSLDVVTIQEFFLMKRDNPHVPQEFSMNHVTGVFFQNKVDYTTWFSSKVAHIHGIQMLPLSPALQLSRSREFCEQEWEDVLQHEQHSVTDKWSSVVFTGNLAIIHPDLAYDKLRSMHATDAMDDGLTKAWAMYWAASQPH
jgi:endo-1,3(4)-beta-glucanase